MFTYDQNEHSPFGRVIDTTPVVDSRLWRGVVIGLLIELAAVAVIGTVAGAILWFLLNGWKF